MTRTTNDPDDQHDTRTGSQREEPSMTGVPHESHGNSVAAWTAVTIVMVGCLVSAIAVLVKTPWLFWAGIVLCAVAVVIGKVLQMMGFGIKREPADH
jgi:fatty acid desaturase